MWEDSKLRHKEVSQGPSSSTSRRFANHHYPPGLVDGALINLFPFKAGLIKSCSEDSFWKRNRARQSRLHRITLFLQAIYERSRLHYLLPIIILVVYSFLGGFVFWSIESPEEQRLLARKKDYVEKEEALILAEVLAVEQRLRFLYHSINNSELRGHEIRKYRSYAMNRINRQIYWYVLQIYYLNDQESYKSSLLHPSKPEKLWRAHFGSSFGRIYALQNYTQQLSERCWEIGTEMGITEAMAKHKLQESIEEFNRYTGLINTLKPTWTFWNSMFLAVTTYSTIGYGNIAPKSRLGKLAAMVYAVIGIPLVLMILHKLGRFFLLCLEHVWNYLLWFMEFVSCVKDAEKLKDRMSGGVGSTTGGMPILVAIGVAFGWTFLCAAVFLKFEEDWDYFKSFYFFFCSLTTIGYGDVTPTNSEDMFIMFGFIIVGLSLVSMCINVIQLKLEELFEELLLTMMEEYADSQVEGPTTHIRPKMGLVDMWKMWNRRRRRNQHGGSAVITGVNLQPEEKPEPPEQGNAAAFLSEVKVWKKMLPFAKRRREVLFKELQFRLHQHSKATQTDFYFPHNLLPPPPPPTIRHQLQNIGVQYEAHCLQHTQEMDEEGGAGDSTEGRSPAQSVRTIESATQSTPPPSTSSSSTMTDGELPISSLSSSISSVMHGGGAGGGKRVRLSISTNPTVSGSDSLLPRGAAHPASSSSSSTSSSSAYWYARRYLPSRRAYPMDATTTRRGTTTSASYSIRSAPPIAHFSALSSDIASTSSVTRTFINDSQQTDHHRQPGNYNGSARRWTFFEIGKTPRGAPRGLAAGTPYMYTWRRAKKHETTEVGRLLAELDSRLLDCRSLVSPCSRSVSRSSGDNLGGTPEPQKQIPDRHLF